MFNGEPEDIIILKLIVNHMNTIGKILVIIIAAPPMLAIWVILTILGVFTIGMEPEDDITEHYFYK